MLVIIGAAAGELGQIVYAIANVSLRQRFCPDRMLGRVNATIQFLIMGLFPFGAFLGGLLGELIGLRGTLWVAAALAVLSPIPLYLALRHARTVDDLPRWDDGADEERCAPGGAGGSNDPDPAGHGESRARVL